jgi:GTP-binding protein LepA
MPLSEVIVDFYDSLKSATSGYGSVSYELIGYRVGDLVDLDVLIAEQKVDAFSRKVYRGFVETVARQTVERLKKYIPKQNFEVKIQAVVGGRILASERIAPYRKDVTEKLYGGDVTRKKKLLEKQKKGKKKMARIGRVDLPTDVFIKLLKI